MNDRKKQSDRIQELDVLRGIAAVIVMIFHYTTVYVYGANKGIAYGVLAVHLFFMISGFVIFMTLSKVRTGFDFMVSRFSRLFPVFWAAVLLTQTVMWFNPAPVPPISWGNALINMTMVAGPLHVPWVDNVYWSLVVELTFYALMLGLFWLGVLNQIERLALPWMSAQVGAVLIKLSGYSVPQVISVLFLLSYAHLFLGGILCYRMRFEGVTAWRQCLLIICLVVQFIVQGLAAGISAVFFFGVFFLLARRQLGWVSTRPLVFLGTISYSLYLIHQNIGYVIMHEMSFASRLVQVMTAVSVALLLATALTYWVEQPVLRFLRYLYRQVSLRPSSSNLASDSAGLR